MRSQAYPKVTTFDDIAEFGGYIDQHGLAIPWDPVVETRPGAPLARSIAVDGRTIKIRTAAYSAMVQKADVERVAFQVDRIDEATHTGWSVLARGRAEVRYGEPEDESGPEPWPRGPRSATVVIDVDEITGRWLNPGER